MELFRISARGDFDSLIANLKAALKEAGFDISGIIDIPKVNQDAYKTSYRYEVIVVDLPRVSSLMLTISSHEGLILPACISVFEKYPGEVDMIVANPAEQFAEENTHLLYLANEITTTLQRIILTFACDRNVTPDLVTSWE